MLQPEFEVVGTAKDGSEAVAAVCELKPDIVILDIDMPVMNGLECVKVLRDCRLSPLTKVMMVTTEADNSFICRALEYGADEFLMKPFTPEGLREKMSMLGFTTAV